ncbi:MAG: bifunctional metallophosphatase/5'-nucleotidase [Elusimicrobiaceae bacterium]
MSRRFFILLCALFLSGFAAAATVNIFHTSDTHGFYFPRKINGKNIGGFSALKAFLQQQQTPYLLLDGGDFSSGTYEAKQSNGNLSVQFMNKLGYAATTIGNHENDFGKANLLKNMDSVNFDILAANMHDTVEGGLVKNVKPFKTYMVNGKKIAVIGLAKEFSTKADGIRISGDKKALKKALYQARLQNPDAIILLTHSSLKDDKHTDAPSNLSLIKGLEGINVVLGGHAHKVCQNVYKDGVLFVESGTALTHVSRITLEFDDETGKFKSANSEFIELDADKYPQDPYIREFAEANRAKYMDTPIGKASETIYNYAPKDAGYIDSPLGNIFADLVKEYTGADIGLQNTGGVRETLNKGEITTRIAYQIFPFPNKPYVVKVKGDLLKKLVLRSLKENKSLFQYSGLEVKYRFKHKRPEIVSVKVNGEDLDPQKTYTIGTNDHIAKGGSEGYMFKNIKDKKMYSQKLITELFTDWVKANPAGIKSAKNGRILKVD